MAWFKSNKVEIANILKGTSDPASSIGDDGQLYLKYANLSLREYIEVGSTAGPYINTGFYWSSDCEFEIKAKWTGTPANNTAFFGAYSPNQDTDVQVYNGNTLFYVGGGGTASLSIDTDDHIYKATQSELLLDGTSVATPNWSRVPASLEVSIFTMQQHSPAINARIYYIKIWKSGELHKYFIPAVNNATNEIGMFEAVSGEFYSNDGTGNFDISSSVISDMPSRPILSSFAKVNDQWQSLIGTNIDDILAGGSKYIKATGSFTSGTETWQKVEVNCGFKPDLVMVDMAFGNGFTRATYLSTAWYEETDHPTSVWDLRPMENVIYAITPGSEQGETGISDLTDTGFKYRVNGGNTQGKACTYTAIKFDVEEVPEPDTSNLLFKDGEFYNTDKVELGIENGVVSDGAILFTTSNTVGGIYFNSSTMDDRFVMAVHYENDNQSVQVRMQYGTSKVGTSVINVINSGTDRYAYASKSVNKGVNDLITVLKETDGDDTIGAFFGNQSANATWKIYEIYLIPY